MILIYHNPRCKKSKEGLALLEDSKKEFEVVRYLDNVPTREELKSIIQKLDIAPIDLVRKQEKIWKDNFKGKSMTDAQVIEAMINYPKLIERPIVVNGDKAVIGRPPEHIKKIL